jgi:V8-like Glu-specific endopeptidase
VHSQYNLSRHAHAGESVDFLHKLKQLISNGELAVAVNHLLLHLGGTNPELYNEAILLSSRLATINNQERRGLTTAETTTVQRNRLAQSALEFLNVLETFRSQDSLPTPETPVSFVAPSLSHLEKVFGVSQLKTISWLQRGLMASASVCRVVTPRGLGSGFLIGSNLLMTNEHVIPNADVAGKSYAEFNYQENVDHSIGPVYRYRLNAEGLRVNPELDYCVAGVLEDSAIPPVSKWGHLSLQSAIEVKPGDHVPIIQHPQGGLKQIAVTANQVANIFDFRLQYMTDTLPGSSGSPVFNDDWNVIAIHHAGGDLLKNAFGQRLFANEGILMKYIVEDLKGHITPKLN